MEAEKFAGNFSPPLTLQRRAKRLPCFLVSDVDIDDPCRNRTFAERTPNRPLDRLCARHLDSPKQLQEACDLVARDPVVVVGHVSVPDSSATAMEVAEQARDQAGARDERDEQPGLPAWLPSEVESPDGASCAQVCW